MRIKKLSKRAFITNGYEFSRDKVDNLYACVGMNNYCKPHFHKQMELLYIYSGSMNVKINKQDFILKKGDFLVCNPFDIHSFQRKGVCVSFVITLPTRFLHYLDKLSGNSRFTNNIIRSSRASKKISKLMFQLALNKNQNDMMLVGLTMIIFDTISTKVGLSNINPQEDSLIYKIINYIDNNYKEPINLETLAQHCNYSKSYISRKFNTTFSCNINEYINLKRLQAFIALHDNSKDNIVDNALSVGFNSVRTFYNAFNEHFNMTPKEYFATQNKEK